jgi:hypothetical protein
MKTGYLILLCAFMVGYSFASDFNPPEWRGLPGSTYQKWTFSAFDLSPIADDSNNPYGTPVVTHTINGMWYDQFMDHQGVWNSHAINFLVPNNTEATNDTTYRVQIIWNTATFLVIDMSVFIRDSLGTVPPVQADLIDRYSSSGWSSMTFEVTAAPFDSPPVVYYETRSYGGSQLASADVDEVIIDAIIIPEPATLLLLAFGGLLLRRNKH